MTAEHKAVERAGPPLDAAAAHGATPTTGAPAGEPRRDRLALLVELCKALSWPLLALLFFVMFYAPIRRTITVIPDKLERSARGNVWSFSWEISENARQLGGSSLALVVGNLSPTAIDVLINAPRHGGAGILGGYGGADQEQGYVFPSHDRLEAFKELEAGQLIQCDEPLSTWLQFLGTLPLMEDTSKVIPYGRVMILTGALTPDQKRRVDLHSYELTPKGRQAVDAIVRAIHEQLQATDRRP